MTTNQRIQAKFESFFPNLSLAVAENMEARQFCSPTLITNFQFACRLQERSLEALIVGNADNESHGNHKPLEK